MYSYADGKYKQARKQATLVAHALPIVTIRQDFPVSLRFRYESQSVSSDQISPLFFLHYYILRMKSGRMKRIGLEISAACYDFVTILQFRYDFVTTRIRFIRPVLPLNI